MNIDGASFGEALLILICDASITARRSGWDGTFETFNDHLIFLEGGIYTYSILSGTRKEKRKGEK